MKKSFLTGFSFGLTSGIITTLGLIMGLHSGTHSKSVVMGGVLTIAIADAFSDAFAIHISKESENKSTPLEIWEASFATFLAKFVFAVSFLVPLLLLEISDAVMASVVYGLLLLAAISYFMARAQKEPPAYVIGEHLLIAIVVIVITHYTGEWIGMKFGAAER